MASFLHDLVHHPDRRGTLVNRRTQRVIASSIETAFDSESRRKGLLGHASLDAGAALIIAPCSSVHMFFMRFPIDVVFAARDGRVIKACTQLMPWRIAGAWGAFAAIELPVGAVTVSETKPGDYLEVTAMAA